MSVAADSLTNRHLCLLARLPADPTLADREKAVFQDLVEAGLATRAMRGGGHPTPEAVPVLRQWLDRSAHAVTSGMTPRMADTLRVITDAARRGISPSYDEIASALGIASKSNVHRLVMSLEARCLVTRLPGRRRSLAPTRTMTVPA